MQLDSLLNPEQREAVESVYGPLLVIAGAGSGKTRVITYRIVHLLKAGIAPSEILAVAFTNKAAAEMKERVRSLSQSDVLICTFHSLGARILRECIHLLDYNRSFTIYDEQDVEKVMKVCLAEIEGGSSLDAKHFLHLISHAKNAMQSPEDYGDDTTDANEKLFKVVYKRYQDKLKEYNAVDFDDLLYLPVRLFKEFPDVLTHYQKRWSFLLIDEYQDTNKAQHAIVKYLVAQHQNLCAVGDPDQSIYSWRGAHISNILDFEMDYPGAKIVRLEQNYRSRTNILEAANYLIKHNRDRYEKKLWSDRGPGERIKHYTADTEKGEAEFISEKIRHYYDNHDLPLRQMAVFYRTNAQSRAFEDRLLLHRIPYVIVGGVSFYQRREIKDILAFLRLVHSGVDFVSFLRTINIPKRGLGETTVEKIHMGASQQNCSLLAFCEMLVNDQPVDHPIRLSAKQKEALKSYLGIIHALREINKECSLAELVKRTIAQTGYLAHLKTDPESYDERQENLNALVSKAIEWEMATPEPTLEGFLEELSLKSSLDEADTVKDRIQLMTIHNGKGLEFDVVFLAGLEEELFPHANSRGSEAAQEEERRLCYVGMTRAKEYLYLCNVRQRFLWGTTRIQNPSRFLREIPEEYIERIRPGFYPQTGKVIPLFQEESVEEPFSDEIAVEFANGEAVFHKDFGVGQIVKSYQSSAGLMYKVLFSRDNKERTLVANLARLKKI